MCSALKVIPFVTIVYHGTDGKALLVYPIMAIQVNCNVNAVKLTVRRRVMLSLTVSLLSGICR